MKAIKVGDKVQVAITPGSNFNHLREYEGITFEVVDLQHEPNEMKDYSDVYLRSPEGQHIKIMRTHLVVIGGEVGIPEGQLVTVTGWEAAPAINWRNLWVVKKESGYFPGSFVYTLRDKWGHIFKVSDGNVLPLKKEIGLG